MESKYAFWGAILAALITGAFSYYIYYDNKKEELKQEKERIAKIEEEKKSSIARVNIDELFLPAINTELDSVFYLKLSNNSYNDVKDLDIKINFGETQVSKCEVQPKPDSKVSINTSIYNYSLKELKKDDSVYIYCFLANPIFDNILISGANIKDSVKKTFSEYKLQSIKEMKKDDEKGITFYEFLFRAFLLIYSGYFTIVLISIINRRLNI
jgi:Ca2+/Na+ antiporter